MKKPQRIKWKTKNEYKRLNLQAEATVNGIKVTGTIDLPQGDLVGKKDAAIFVSSSFYGFSSYYGYCFEMIEEKELSRRQAVAIANPMFRFVCSEIKRRKLSPVKGEETK